MAKEIEKKQNRGSNWMNADSGAPVEDADKQRVLGDAMHRSALFDESKRRPYKYTLEEVQERVEKHFVDCFENYRRPTLTTLCTALDVVPDTLRDWRADKSKPFYDVIQRACLLIQDFEEQMALEGKTNLIYAIFRDKSRWGFVEKTALEIVPPPDPLGEPRPPEEREAYIKAISDGMPDIEENE